MLVLMSLYVKIKEQYFVNITMATECMHGVLQSHKWDKPCACLSMMLDAIGIAEVLTHCIRTNSVIINTLLFIWGWVVVAAG